MHAGYLCCGFTILISRATYLCSLASTSSVPLLGHAGNLVLMGVILDVLYRAATNKFESSHAEEDSLFSLRSVGQKKKKKEKMERPMSFENTFILSTTPLKWVFFCFFVFVCLFVCWGCDIGFWRGLESGTSPAS